MENDVVHETEQAPEVHHHKPRHIAEKLESYVVIAMGIAGAILLIVLIYFFMQTGSGTPSWMR
jgi:hypothetical protein